MLMMRAYDIKHYQLTAPDWTAGANYEINATLARDATKEQFREMIRNLLAERFKLEFHWSTKDMALYDLVVAKGGPKLKEWIDAPGGGSNNDPPGWGGGGKGPVTDVDGYPNIRKIATDACRSTRRGRLGITRPKRRQRLSRICSQISLECR